LFVDHHQGRIVLFGAERKNLPLVVKIDQTGDHGIQGDIHDTHHRGSNQLFAGIGFAEVFGKVAEIIQLHLVFDRVTLHLFQRFHHLLALFIDVDDLVLRFEAGKVVAGRIQGIGDAHQLCVDKLERFLLRLGLEIHLVLHVHPDQLVQVIDVAPGFGALQLETDDLGILVVELDDQVFQVTAGRLGRIVENEGIGALGFRMTLVFLLKGEMKIRILKRLPEFTGGAEGDVFFGAVGRQRLTIGRYAVFQGRYRVYFKF